MKALSFFVGSRVWFNMLLLILAISILPIEHSTAQPTVAQKKEQLQTQMKKLQDEIKLIQSAIKANSAKKEKSMGELLSLQAKIASREKLIGNISGQIGNLDESIDEAEVEIERRNREVEKMKGDYANMLRKSYENITLQNKIAFLLSSQSFYEAFLRYNYLLKIAEFRKNQAEEIQKSVVALREKRENLQQTKEEKETLLLKQTAQKEELESEKQEKDKAVALLLEKEKKLKRQNEEKNKAIKQLNARIQAIIEDEIRQARKKAEELAKKNPSAPPSKTTSTKPDAMPMTPEELALNKDFTNNKGKLPWPVVKGHIVSYFGKHEHPLLKGVMTENNGIDIKTEANADARSIFAGTVVSIFFLPTVQNCVIVKHGEYFSVYSGIETVAVKPNQVIATKQALGKLHSEKAEDLTKIHIEIWKGKEKMDPSLWLAGAVQ
ncbi:MAG: peptidoglycan DD-metalloendopeptidase family protein [Chitinophagales bacterium]|nr:peptidoglycan DD-metalloendopeptidase family protein [Chitinophagales bacterium]